MSPLIALLLLSTAPAPRTITLDVGGVARTALVYFPKSGEPSRPAPLVFCWHGHGGSSAQAARSFRIHEHWPEAAVAYPQGLPTPGRYDPEGKRAGWQRNEGDQSGRDLAFFDALLARLKKERPIDTKRIYAMGHSNGGRFTFLLWAARGDVFAAFGPSGSPAVGLAASFKPKSAFVVAGEQDRLVSFAGMKAGIESIRRLLRCSEFGKPEKNGYLTREKGVGGTELAAYVHPGGHEFPADGGKLIAEFFKRHFAR